MSEKLLEKVLKEVDTDELENVEGGIDMLTISYAYGAIVGGFSTCSFPVGLLESHPMEPGIGTCTTRTR
ncbi:hypothetical protein SAMN04487829_1063 [Pseudobutyrivibrio sp. NOR37]|uniref:Uncharacterized protein n=2 Tax=Pseudobutyrivibrio TaxID=46205 RepID=A0A2G3E8C1_9FIRM|nr:MULTISPECIES: hypothetical protein [Pseudobutyrivibrio]NEX01470.1 hypothetical protein [Pseudobutyrivibrio xylanivorans]PHU39539.1 hypothetical protein CSX00_11025 [Pseudobutyrivibrio ruminis]SFR67741.1 hypothetical protein SAMN04487829_1063 [Pseudobutyrivibrio sp. NOR37]